MSENRVSIYHYGAAMTVGVASMTVAVGILDVYLLFFFAKSHDLLGALIMIALSPFPVFLVRAVLSRVSIVVSEVKIAATLFGLQIKSIEWTNIQKIIKSRVYNGYAYIDIFHVQDRNHNSICKFFINLCGNLVFTQDIHNLRGLLSEVNLYARRHNIPLAVWNTEAAAAELRSRQGGSYWKRATAKILETTVREL
jgi:hypothetical protein